MTTVGSMSKHVRSRSVWEVVLRDEESSEPVGPVLGLLPSDEQPPQGEAPSQSQEITPGQDNEDERAPEVQDPDPEADLQELALAKTGREGKVKGESSPNTQPFQMPAAGPDPETDLQDLAQLNTGDEGSDGPDVMEDILPKPESIYMPEAGPDPEDDLRELAQPKTDREGGDGPDLTQELVSKLETVHMPEAEPASTV
ncbi:P antigen family member 3 isoform X2 [Rhinolophus sinicus]|uniref:P antigen family member 3 isoform X2 n=1 Tax=Rhinolophus sinicus TaxID=89399 RepID=UPI003D7B1537